MQTNCTRSERQLLISGRQFDVFIGSRRDMPVPPTHIQHHLFVNPYTSPRVKILGVEWVEREKRQKEFILGIGLDCHCCYRPYTSDTSIRNRQMIIERGWRGEEYVMDVIASLRRIKPTLSSRHQRRRRQHPCHPKNRNDYRLSIPLNLTCRQRRADADGRDLVWPTLRRIERRRAQIDAASSSDTNAGRNRSSRLQRDLIHGQTR